MTVERAQRSKELFNAALELDPDERKAFLEQACAEDAALRAEVERLLGADAEAGRFLESPFSAVTAPEIAGDPASAMIGREIGAYRIVGLIASGGMGTVYEAMQQRPHRRVALKLLKAGLTSKSALRRFAHEAEILGRLRHPGIAQVYDAGTHMEGPVALPYFAMEHIADAKALTEYAAAHGLGTRQRLELFTRVCDAVHYGHQRGVIHRDLKPANILVDELGQPRVIDFGVALATDVDMTISTLRTDIGALVGTLRYMSPEQCAGDPREVDTRSDVYALGVVLYELLTGRLPYETSTTSAFEIPRIIREQEPCRLSSINRRLRGDVETITLKALEKNRERRYQSVAGLAQDIRRYLSNEPIEARRDRAWYVLRKTLARYKLATGVACAFVLLVTGSAIGFGVLYRIADRQKTLAEQQHQVAIERAEALRRTAYFNSIALAQHAYETANTANLLDLLGQCPADLRGWEWYYLRRLSDTSRMVLRGHAHHVTGLAVSPDGKTIASGSRDRTIKLWDAASGEELRTLTGHEHFVHSVAFSPDGRWLASSSYDRTVRVWNAVTGELRHVLRGHRNPVLSVQFSPDGERIASSGEATIKLWDADTGEQQQELSGHEGGICNVVWLPDGRRLVTGSDDTTLRVWDLEAGAEVRTLVGHTDKVRRVACSPDGLHIASVSWDNTLRIWATETGELLTTIDRDTEKVLAVAFSSDGKRVAATTFSALRVWDVATGQPEFICLGHVDAVLILTFSPDDSAIITGSNDGTIRVWDAAPQEEPPALSGHQDGVRGVAVSPDGRFIASAGHDETVRVWDVGSRTQLMTLRGHTDCVAAVAFRADGHYLASAGFDKTIRIWDVVTGDPTEVLEGHRAAVHDVAWSPDSRHIASAGLDGTVKLWDAQSGQLVLDRDAHKNGVLSVAFSPEGARMVTAGNDGVVRVWNTEDVEQVREMDTSADRAGSAVFSHSGDLVAAADSDWNVRVWRADTGEPVHALRGHLSAVQAVDFSPDQRRLVSTGYDHLVKIWDVETGQLALTLHGHDRGIPGVAFSPGGRWFVTASNDNTLRIWDAGPGERAD